MAEPHGPDADEDPEIRALLEELRRGRRSRAKWLIALGLGIAAAAGVTMAYARHLSAVQAGGDIEFNLPGTLTTAAALVGAIGLGLVGTGVFVLSRNGRPGGR